MERSDSIVSPQVLVWQNQEKRENKHTKFTLPYHRVSEDMDIETLQDGQHIALETVQELTIQLARAQSHAWNIAKRTLEGHYPRLRPAMVWQWNE